MRELLKIDFIRFCLVGAIGFLLNLAILNILYKVLSLPIFVSQLIAAEFALFSNFNMHHNWTYKHKKISKSIKLLLIQFHATTWPAILGSSLVVSVCVNFFHLNSSLALIISSAIALLWNFAWSKFVVWKNDNKLDTRD